nr:ClpXP protease specificity-enhancing factor [Rhodocyclus tenuis]
MPSTKPYLIRAIHEWCTDNGFTPYLAVTVDAHTVVPREYVRDGQIVLNIAYDATNRLTIGAEWIEFQARFGGVARELSVPVAAVSAIYARENGAGMAFEPEASTSPATAVLASDGTTSPDSPPSDSPPPASRPRLQRVK